MADGVVYIKIAKIDKNGNNQTNTLQSLNQLIVPYSTGDIVYKVKNITEKPTFFLYYVDPTNVEWADRADLYYNFTGSLEDTDTPLGAGNPASSISNITSITDSLSFLESYKYNNGFERGNQYVVNTYPQKEILFRASGSITSTTNPSNTHKVGIYLNNTALIESATFTPSSGDFDFDLVCSSSAILPTDFITFRVKNTFQVIGVNFDFSAGSRFFVSSSIASGPQVGLVPEPYFGSNDFARALDCQPLLNNAERVRKHNLYQDVDYSAGATEPVNFDLLISGSAIRADVQYSNYTSKRVIIPRYEGSKTTSKNLNRWTPGDTGTYGKTPTVESLKTVIAYCDWIGSWPPERNNSSAAHILYLIDSDGNIGIPNTSENSLPNVQGAFQTGDRFRLSSRTIGSGKANPLRTVIRGGQRIEPILYTQSGSAPNQQFNTTLTFEDINPAVGGNVANYISTNTPTGNQTLTNNTWEKVLYPYVINGSHIASSEYTVPSGVIADGVSLRVTANRKISLVNWNPNGGLLSLDFRVVKKRGSSYTYYDLAHFETGFTSPTQYALLSGEVVGTAEIPLAELNVNDKLYVEVKKIQPDNSNIFLKSNEGWLKVWQYPTPTAPIEVTGSNLIWNWGDPNTHPHIITSSNQTLIDVYGETARQQTMTGSGFNPSVLPFTIKYGDEFRFEGREDFTYMVSKIFTPEVSGSGRIFPGNGIEVHFNGNLPTGSSSSAFNLDHFLIRRYVDDASQILMEGFKPENSSGPFILTPEYSTKDLNINIDDVITDLKERGLITGEEGT